MLSGAQHPSSRPAEKGIETGPFAATPTWQRQETISDRKEAGELMYEKPAIVAETNAVEAIQSMKIVRKLDNTDPSNPFAYPAEE